MFEKNSELLWRYIEDSYEDKEDIWIYSKDRYKHTNDTMQTVMNIKKDTDTKHASINVVMCFHLCYPTWVFYDISCKHKYIKLGDWNKMEHLMKWVLIIHS